MQVQRIVQGVHSVCDKALKKIGQSLTKKDKAQLRKTHRSIMELDLASDVKSSLPKIHVISMGDQFVGKSCLIKRHVSLTCAV